MKRLLDRPHHLLQVSLKCNLTCSYCTSQCSPKEPPSYVEAHINEVVSLFGGLAPSVIGVTGGEPLLWAGMPSCIAALPQHYWMVWTNLTVIRDWMMHDNVKLVHAAYHFGFTPHRAYVANVKTLRDQGKRVVCKILTPRQHEHDALRICDIVMELGVPPALVPVEYQSYSGQNSRDFLKKVVSSHLTSVMFNGRFFRSPIESKMCAAGTRESILVMADGRLQRCAAVQMASNELGTDGNIIAGAPTLARPVFLAQPEPCLSQDGCWCEPNHYGCTARANENERVERYVTTGEWHRPTGDDLLAFLETSGWNAQVARSLMAE